MQGKKKRQDILALKKPQHYESSFKCFFILKSLKRGILNIHFNPGYKERIKDGGTCNLGKVSDN